MADARDPRDVPTDEAPRPAHGLDDLVAPRRVFKRKPNRRLVLTLKFVLPVIAVASVSYIVVWSRTHQSVINPVEVVQDVGKQSSDVTVKRVKYDGIDNSSRPFTITAESADQPQDQAPPAPSNDDDNSDHVAKATGQAKPTKPDKSAPGVIASNVINLHQLEADMTLVNGAWVAVTADDGVYDRGKGTVDLTGDVTLFHDTGLSFQTDAATIDLNNAVARGDSPIEGAHPQGELAAEGFEVRDDGATVVFTGRAYLKLYPTPAANPKGGAQ
ncbi:MAG TPA: LPS export ABC transporter periplasmic protein LptC [Candidatus Cybelea sp.]|nr:LPS export ABC transporter periplasmic protein LptC [Candidatus Cybelea sp.]